MSYSQSQHFTTPARKLAKPDWCYIHGDPGVWGIAEKQIGRASREEQGHLTISAGSG